jgi:hypothetical protein
MLIEENVEAHLYSPVRLQNKTGRGKDFIRISKYL